MRTRNRRFALLVSVKLTTLQHSSCQNSGLCAGRACVWKSSSGAFSTGTSFGQVNGSIAFKALKRFALA